MGHRRSVRFPHRSEVRTQHPTARPPRLRHQTGSSTLTSTTVPITTATIATVLKNQELKLCKHWQYPHHLQRRNIFTDQRIPFRKCSGGDGNTPSAIGETVQTRQRPGLTPHQQTAREAKSRMSAKDRTGSVFACRREGLHADVNIALRTVE